jgi:hypothetical protein
MTPQWRTDATHNTTPKQSSAPSRHKERMQDLDAEAAVDRVATEIVVLVEQGLLNSTGPRNSTQPSLEREEVHEQEDSCHRRHGIATAPVDRTEFTGQDDIGIPAWVMA